MALLDGRPVVAEDFPSNAVISCLDKVATSQSSGLVTIYYGAGTTQEEALALAGEIREKHPHLGEDGVEVVDGGQPLYQYIVSVE
jgi:dihydroxyacetone kinase-like predicted kinase